MKELLTRLQRELEKRGLPGIDAAVLKKLGIVAVILVFGGALLMGQEDQEEIRQLPEDTTITEETVPDKVLVDIAGEVQEPMVVELDDGSRVCDAIDAAGGLTEDADLSSINRAAFVNDGDKIYIPSLKETAEAGTVSGDGAVSLPQAAGKVNINTADEQELQTLTGIGPVTAEKIVQYRESNGRFTSIEDIKKVSGIGEKTFEKLKDSITT